jgi:hypothetical protein
MLVTSLLLTCSITIEAQQASTVVTIKGNQFLINGRPTYPGRVWKGHKIEGLLMNSRMVQGIFNDENPETRTLFLYPDTRQWNPDRNTNEFVKAMSDWKRYGLKRFHHQFTGREPYRLWKQELEELGF